MKAAIFAFGIIGIFGVVGCGGAPVGEAGPTVASAAPLSSADAIAKARQTLSDGERQSVDGESAALESEEGHDVWHVSFSGGAGGEEVVIDAGSGEILRTTARPATAPYLCNGLPKPLRACNAKGGWTCCNDGTPWQCGSACY
jgi:hypothetical protein